MKIALAILIIGMVLLALNLVSADSFCFLKLSRGEQIHITQTDFYSCAHTSCQVCVNESRWYAAWTRCDSNCVEAPGPRENLTLRTEWPFEDGGAYNKPGFRLEIYTNKPASINLIDNVGGRQRNLCSSCTEYTGSYSFQKGFNDITIVAEADGQVEEESISFTVDSKKPRITKTTPSSNSYIGSEFTVEYSEENIESVELHYGVEGDYRTAEMNCESGVRVECSVDVNLDDFDGEKISYWFVIEDVAGNVVESSHVSVYVDESSPEIVSLDYVIEGRYLILRMGVEEDNLYRVEYQEEGDYKLKSLCTSLKEGYCEKKVSFKDGEHVVSLQVSDKAGHVVGTSLEFFTDSKKPRITKTLPSSGFASGDFYVEFSEENPVELVLNYGNDESGFREEGVNLESCWDNKGKSACNLNVDLSSLDGEEIYYVWTLRDRVDSTTQSKQVKLKVDVSPPEIGSFDYVLDETRRTLTLELEVEDANFNKVEYIDNSENSPRLRTVCSSLRFGVCSKKVYLRAGEHDIDIKISDKAGNSEIIELEEFEL